MPVTRRSPRPDVAPVIVVPEATPAAPRAAAPAAEPHAPSSPPEPTRRRPGRLGRRLLTAALLVAGAVILGVYGLLTAWYVLGG